MKSALAVAALLLAACSRPDPLPEPTDTRAPIATQYVTGPELPVHTQANETSPVTITYQNGESVQVLAHQGEWTEIRVGDGSGWAKTADLGSAAAAQQQSDGEPQVRFRKPPGAVTNLTAKGAIYIEADVNTDGDVVKTRILENTTGSPALADANAAALGQAKFYPILKNGERQPFKYYHRVSY
jgi:uncharacterized protein YgiM (DUF1202 family)